MRSGRGQGRPGAVAGHHPHCGSWPHLLAQHQPATVVVGLGTGSDRVREFIRQAVPQVPLVDIEEAHSTLQARELYWRDYPPRGWQRLLPAGLRLPPRPVDDYAAVILAQRYLRNASPTPKA